jgi:hypothetical protein
MPILRKRTFESKDSDVCLKLDSKRIKTATYWYSSSLNEDIEAVAISKSDSSRIVHWGMLDWTIMGLGRWQINDRIFINTLSPPQLHGEISTDSGIEVISLGQESIQVPIILCPMDSPPLMSLLFKLSIWQLALPRTLWIFTIAWLRYKHIA